MMNNPSGPRRRVELRKPTTWSEPTPEAWLDLQELFPAESIVGTLEETSIAMDPTQLVKSHITQGVASLWHAWFPSRCLDTIYRKLLYYLSARGAGWNNQELMAATLIVPLHLDVSADREDHGLVGDFLDAARTSAPKCLVHPLYDEPYPTDWEFQRELFSTVVNEPIAVERDRLVLFLVGSASTQGPVRALGLREPDGMGEVGTGPLVFRLDTLAKDIDDGLDAGNEAALIGSTLRCWVDALFEHLTAAPLTQDIFSLPAPPRPDLIVSHPDVVQRSFLPRIFQVIQKTLCPDDPSKIGCYLVSPSRDGTTLYALGKSDNYPPITMPDIRLLTADGMNWHGADGMGLTGRAELYQQQVVSRFGDIDITPEEVRDTRPIYARKERLKEATALPIRGGSEKASGLGVAVHSDHSYADLYVYTTQKDLLKTAHVLWLRELATVVGEYFGWASASSMRDRQLARDREIGYRSILAAVDSERSKVLAPLLRFIANHVAEAEQLAGEAGEAIEPERHAPLSDEAPGVTFLYLYIAGDQQTTGWYRRGDTPERVIFRLEELVCTIQKRWVERHWITDAQTVCYQGGILAALTLAPGVTIEALALMVHHYLRHCRCDWGITGRPSLGVFCFHRAFDELVDLGFGPEAGAAHVGLYTLHIALRRFNPTLTRFRKAFEQVALSAPAVRGYVAVEDPRTDNLHWLEPKADAQSQPYFPRAVFDEGVARVKRVGLARW